MEVPPGPRCLFPLRVRERDQERASSRLLFAWKAKAQFNHFARRHQRIAADMNWTRLRRNHFSVKWPPRIHAEGGQVEPVLGGCFLCIGHPFRRPANLLAKNHVQLCGMFLNVAHVVKQ